MVQKLVLFFALVGICFSATTEISIKGKVNGGGAAVGGADLSLIKYPDIKAVSDTGGLFELKGSIETGVAESFGISFEHGLRFGTRGDRLYFSVSLNTSTVVLTIFSANGRRVHTGNLGAFVAGMHDIALPELPTGFYVLHLIADGTVTSCKLIATANELFVDAENTAKRPVHGFAGITAAAATVIDSLIISKTGFEPDTIGIGSYTVSDLQVELTKEVPDTCAGFEVPPVAQLKANPMFPDPFAFVDGTRIAKKAQWPCLRKHLIGLLGYSHGNLPEEIGEVSGKYSGGKLLVTVKVNGKEESFEVSIKNVPSGEGPFPAIITLGGSTVSIPSGIAQISLPQNTIANEKSRSGVYSKLYGSDKTGSMLMWAWGVGRIIDALEMTTGHKINPARLGVTGCSRNGKGAMVCGAYEERIALTLPMEGGSGGISSWRIAEVENKDKGEHPDGCQTASQIVGESGWLAPQFDQFAKGSVGLDKLPVDAHTLAAICAPRAMLFVEGSKNSWNCNVCCWTAASAAQMVYEALGAKDHIGIVMTDHNHCSGYSNAEKEAFNAFCKRFLLDDESVSTEEYFYNDGKFDNLIDFDKWIGWTAPELQ